MPLTPKNNKQMNGYTLIREWFNFKFENPDKVNSKHSEFFCYLVDKWNRLGQKETFGLPTEVTMEVLGIGSFNTYKKIFQDLIDFGFVELIKNSKNQHSSKIVALSFFDKATNKALDKASDKAIDKAIDKAPYKATDSIIEQINKQTNKQINREKYKKEVLEIFESYQCVVKHQELTEEMSKLCELAITNSSLEFVLASIKNYNDMLQDPDFFFKYWWNFPVFLKKQKGKSVENYKRFNEGGDLFMSFKQHQMNKKHNQPETNPNPYSKLVVHT